jgi:hypothetical protein
MAPALGRNYTYCLGDDDPVLELPLAYRERIFHQANTAHINPHHLMRLVPGTAGMLAVKLSESEYHYWDSM